MLHKQRKLFGKLLKVCKNVMRLTDHCISQLWSFTTKESDNGAKKEKDSGPRSQSKPKYDIYRTGEGRGLRGV